MGRTGITPIQQPNNTTCGPSALKHALTAFGKRKSLESIMELCKTNRNGTSTKNMIRAARKLGFATLVMENATLKHLISALRYQPNKQRAVLVSYLYDLDTRNRPHPESGHWAMVSSYHARNGRVVVLDSASAKKKSYNWMDFRERWMDYDLTRRRINRRRYKLIRKWQRQLLFVLAGDRTHLPRFSLASQS